MIRGTPMGQIWRLEVGQARYPLKQVFADPPPEALIEAERASFVSGVRLPPMTSAVTGLAPARNGAGTPRA
ncbi:hypothetical protein ACIBG4_28610 [Nonomuraea sp. NPDC050383]|uniref:hypothetical protein n=1 Tax=Nonomuraea sp. NPDC050383 TaxID=3364362 RepID=UPI0037B0656C